MSRLSPEAYLFGGAGMVLVGTAMLIGGLQKPTADELIPGTVLDTRAYKGDFKVTVEWVDRAGQTKQSVVVVSDADIPTKGTVLQLIPARSSRGDVELAQLKYRITPALGLIGMGLLGVAIGLATRE